MAKKIHIANQLKEHSKNLKKTWQILFDTIRKSKKKNREPISIKLNDDLICDPAAVANHLNDFFINTPHKISSLINPSNKSPTEHIQQNLNNFSLTNVPITLNEILKKNATLNDKKTHGL